MLIQQFTAARNWNSVEHRESQRKIPVIRIKRWFKKNKKNQSIYFLMWLVLLYFHERLFKKGNWHVQRINKDIFSWMTTWRCAYWNSSRKRDSALKWFDFMWGQKSAGQTNETETPSGASWLTSAQKWTEMMTSSSFQVCMHLCNSKKGTGKMLLFSKRGDRAEFTQLP